MNSKYSLSKYTMTVQEVAEMLNYNNQYVRMLAREGRLPALKTGRKWLFCEQELLDRLRSLTKDAVKKNIQNERHALDETEGFAETSDLFL